MHMGRKPSAKVGRVRTTVTLDPDVAKILDGLQRERGQGLSEVLNDIVRSGVTAPARRPRFVQRTTDLGAPTVPLDCTGGLLEFLDQAEVRAAGGKP
jgi:hypothetical protein